MAPFRYDAPDNRFGATIADILAHQNDAASRSSENIAALQAQGAGQSARAWGNAVQNIGGTIAEALDPVRRQTVALRARQQDLEAQRLGMENTALQSKMDETERAKKARSAIAVAVSKTPRQADGTYDIPGILGNVPEEFLGDAEPHLSVFEHFNQSAGAENLKKQQSTRQAAGQFMASGAWQDPISMDAFISTLENNAMITKDEGSAYRAKMIEDPANGKGIVSRFVMPEKVEKLGPGDILVQGKETIAENKPVKPARTQAINGQVVDLDTGKRIGEPVPPQETPANAETARHNAELERIASMTAGRAQASAEETARHNRASEESARNRVQARPMLSGDANRVADIDTSLSQLTSLRDSVKNTGAVSGIESAMPNFVTEYTGGIGEDAKARNAQIALVRQIIGKALEGGVLRKEDEIKYKAILPTISDAPAVAAKKLDGLEVLLKEKRSNILESLGDAGYNVDKMTARAPDAPAAPAMIRARDAQGKLHEAPAGTALPAGWKLEP